MSFLVNLEELLKLTMLGIPHSHSVLACHHIQAPALWPLSEHRLNL